jgi:hypothetical protein
MSTLEFRFNTRKEIAARLHRASKLLCSDGQTHTEVCTRALVLGFYQIAREREESEPGLETELRDLLHHA